MFVKFFFNFSSQTKVDNACLVGVGYTQTLRPGKLIVCFFFSHCFM